MKSSPFLTRRVSVMNSWLRRRWGPSLFPDREAVSGVCRVGILPGHPPSLWALVTDTVLFLPTELGVQGFAPSAKNSLRPQKPDPHDSHYVVLKLSPDIGGTICFTGNMWFQDWGMGLGDDLTRYNHQGTCDENDSVENEDGGGDLGGAVPVVDQMMVLVSTWTTEKVNTGDMNTGPSFALYFITSSPQKGQRANIVNNRLINFLINFPNAWSKHWWAESIIVRRFEQTFCLVAAELNERMCILWPHAYSQSSWEQITEVVCRGGLSPTLWSDGRFW